MNFTTTLEEGIFLKRYKRFFADVRLKSGEVIAHVPNTGTLKSCLQPGTPALVSRSSNPNRKLAYTLEFLKPGDSWIGVNTARSNDLVWEVWQKRWHTPWHQFVDGAREVKINDQTRLDFCLYRDSTKKKCHFIEVKNVTLRDGSEAQFPDAVTTRGQKHLQELIDLIGQGHTAEIIFTVQRSDCSGFSPADIIDPAYGELLRKAAKTGLIISAWPCEMTLDRIQLNPHKPLPLVF